MMEPLEEGKGLIFDIQRYCIEDGPGIRTTVFLKGCPLHCFWCANPESQVSSPELMYRFLDCTQCLACIKVCKNGAPRLVGDRIVTDRGKCTACGSCIASCSNGARQIAGELRSVEEILTEVEQDMLFYNNSGGGITISGGEPLYQPTFTLELLKECYSRGIHTVLETCGYASKKVILEIAEYVDLFLFDLKHLDSATHEQCTGGKNTIIFENLIAICQAGNQVIVRCPFIPGFNDNLQNILALAKFLGNLKGIGKVELLPYHDLGREKYNKLDRDYPWEGEKTTDEMLNKAIDLIRENGVEAALVR